MPEEVLRKPIREIAETNVEVLEDWLPYSPDLNSIRHIWACLKKLEHGHYSNSAVDTRLADGIKFFIQGALIRCWELILDTLFENLVKSIPRRSAAVTAEWFYIRC